MALRLKVTDWIDATRWRWLLEDADGRFVADHAVRLDPASREYRGFCELGQYLDYHAPVATPAAQLQALGQWIGERVFGGLRDALRQRCRAPAEAVQVLIPAAAHELLARPFEIACFADGKRFGEAGLRFVYQGEAATAGTPLRGAALRLLAVFSLPVRANPLNLRRERYRLQQLVRSLNQTRGMAVELRVLQYGATRETLREALEEGEGWDLVHLSGHGLQGELLLETEEGGNDPIDAAALGDLLALTRERLQLLILDACYSGAASHAAARAQVGLETSRAAGLVDEALTETARTPLPSLGFALAAELDCAVFAMRYPVGDAFATELMLGLYEKLLDKRQRLPAALQLALGEALRADIPQPALSAVTPILLGARAATLQLVAPQRPPGPIALPTRGLIGFPPEPQRFVGRLQPMLRASQALAPGSERRGVLFHGMPGAGKTACALELAYRHEQGRFAGQVWYAAPQADSDIAPALFTLLFEVQRQLNAPDLGLTTALDDPQRFRDYTLPRLRALLEQNALLLVLDNLETLLTDSNQWRIPLWGAVIETLLAQNGPSRVLLTSRRAPAALAHDVRLQIEPIHALSFAESVLLAHELPQLKRLFADAPGRSLLQHTLRVVQGHPKLLEMADALAADRAALATRVAAGEAELATHGEVLDAFFAVGGTREGETRQPAETFIQALQGWTDGLTARLSPTGQLLFAFLCRLEPDDRRQDVLQANWADFLRRLGDSDAAAVAALAAPENGVPTALEALRAAGLLEVSRPTFEAGQLEALAALESQAPAAGAPDAAALQQLRAALAAQATSYAIHPGVAEAARATAAENVLAAADVELGDYHRARVRHGLETEGAGGGETVVDAARRGVPYLMRAQRWDAASTLLETLLQRDQSPEALAYALPLLERIVAATAGTDRGLVDAGVLARALWEAGRTEEAERRQREIVTCARQQGDHRLASGAGGDLANLLRASGRLNQALEVVEAKAEDTRRAGLGPWTRLADEGRRLQVLAVMGRSDEVLAEVERLRTHMATLPLVSDVEEAVNPWNVREGLLDTGRSAALHSKRWQQALALNADMVQLRAVRGATALERARTRYNDYFPLLRLQRVDDARKLLQECRKVFEDERQVEMLGKIYSALADLEDKMGDRATAVRFEELALGYKYQHGDPEGCAVSHHNLANYLEREGDDLARALAHRLADATIMVQTRSGGLSTTLHNLRHVNLPPAPPPFAEVVAQVERVPGVRFAALCERLPPTFADGDAALAEVWRLLAETREHEAAQQRAMLQQFEPLLQMIAAVARGDDEPRATIEALLPDLETKGFKLTQPVERLWAGERGQAALLTGLDPADTALVRRLVELVEDGIGQQPAGSQH